MRALPLLTLFSTLYLSHAMAQDLDGHNESEEEELLNYSYVDWQNQICTIIKERHEQLGLSSKIDLNNLDGSCNLSYQPDPNPKSYLGGIAQKVTDIFGPSGSKYIGHLFLKDHAIGGYWSSKITMYFPPGSINEETKKAYKNADRTGTSTKMLGMGIYFGEPENNRITVMAGALRISTDLEGNRVHNVNGLGATFIYTFGLPKN